MNKVETCNVCPMKSCCSRSYDIGFDTGKEEARIIIENTILPQKVKEAEMAKDKQCDEILLGRDIWYEVTEIPRCIKAAEEKLIAEIGRKLLPEYSIPYSQMTMWMPESFWQQLKQKRGIA